MTTEMAQEKHILTMMKLLNCQVCSEGTEEEALAWLQQTSPAGTMNNWQSYDYADNPTMKPLKCEKYPERTHYMFVC